MGAAVKFSASLAEKAFAKINLTLRVVGRRADGYHELESLVAFADLADTLTLTPGARDKAQPVRSLRGGIARAQPIIWCSRRVAHARRACRRAQGRVVSTGEGDSRSPAASAAARRTPRRRCGFFRAANAIAADDARLAAAALKVGADVPVCLEFAPARHARRRREAFRRRSRCRRCQRCWSTRAWALPTRDVFAAFAAAPQASEPLDEVPGDSDALLGFLARHGNELTEAAIAFSPVVAEVLRALCDLPGVRLARMSGSGATCFALMSSASAAADAARRIKAAHPGWWVHAGHIGAPP